MSPLSDRIYRAIRIWQKAKKAGAHPSFLKRLAANVDKLSEEKRKHAKPTKDTIA